MLISRSFIICLFNVTLNAKSALHISQFVDKKTNKQTEISKTEATLIPWVAGLTGPIFDTVPRLRFYTIDLKLFEVKLKVPQDSKQYIGPRHPAFHRYCD